MKLGEMSYRPAIIDALKGYNKQIFYKDLIAGVIVGVVALPLAIAFGIASGVTPEKGIISSIIAGFFVATFGGSRFQISGPTGALTVIIAGVMGSYGFEGLMIATFIAGILLVLMGLFKFGSIIKYIPFPIIIGFTSGVAVVIFTSQVRDFLGLDIHGTLPQNFLEKWGVYFSAIDTINPWAVGVAVLTILLIQYTLKISRRIPAYLLAIIIVSIMVYIARNYFGIEGIQTIGDKFMIDSSIPGPQNLGLNFNKIRELFSAGVTIAVFGAMVSLLSSTLADGLTDRTHNPNNELVGQGIANVISPIFGGIPVTGAIARTVTNINNGGRTPISSIVHAIVLLVVLLFLGSLSKHIPMACLAGILTVVSYNMCEWRTFKALLRTPKADVAVLLVTFLLTVIFDLTIAIEVGIVLSVLMFVRRASAAISVSVVRDFIDTGDGTDIIGGEIINIPKGVEVYEIEGAFFFGIANKLEDIRKVVGVRPKVRILRMRRVPFIDSTGIHNLEILCKNSKKDKIHLIFSGVKGNVKGTIEKSGIAELIGADNIFDNVNDAVEKAKIYISEIEKSEK